MIRVYLRGDANNNMYAYKASREEVFNVPEWLPDKSNPPLTIPGALTIAKVAAQSEFPQYKDFEVGGLDINPIPVPSFFSQLKNRWFYVVELHPKIDGETQRDDRVWVVVLMDGTVIKPTPWKLRH